MNKDSEKLLDRWIFHAYKSGNTVLPILPKEKNGVKTKSKDKKKQKKSPHQTSQHRDPFTTDAAQHLRANALVDNSTEQAQLKN
ncbi:MAG TPA: hypothetical protein PLY93_03380, partial [Turneriella sp.]|nr:hypothetical protein [Turneriella sp.]